MLSSARMDSATFVNSPPSWAELERVLTLCDPSGVRGTVLTFAPAAGAHFAGAWNGWLTRTFTTYLLEAITTTMNATASDHSREVFESDASLSAALSEGERSRLSVTGKRALDHFGGLRGSRPAMRLAAEALAGKVTGLFPIVFAVRAALYHVAPTAALLAYAVLEWRGGLHHAGSAASDESTATALTAAARLIGSNMRAETAPKMLSIARVR